MGDNADPETQTLSTPILRLRETVDPWLRRIMFPQRSTKFVKEFDHSLKNMVNSMIAIPDRAVAELELETREWLRDFWSRSIVAWIAIVISIISVVFAVCAFFRH